MQKLYEQWLADDILEEVERRLDEQIGFLTTENWQKQHPLLLFFEACVRDDTNPAAMEGSVAVIVKRPLGPQSWLATFHEHEMPETEFVDGHPGDWDTAIGLGEQDADAMLSGGSVPEDSSLKLVSGDKDLLNKFIERYIVKK